MIRWFSIGVICYMILGITWWGVLIYDKNQELYDVRVKASDKEFISDLELERSRQNKMIFGEGIVLGLSLLLGVYIINRSANKEIKNARNQNDFFLSVSHELKSPIAAIRLALQTLKREGLTRESRIQFLSSAIKDASRLEKMVQNILLSANLDNSDLQMYKERYSAKDLIDPVVTKYDNRIKSELVVSIEENSSIYGDRQNLQQAIVNLLDNAIKYSTDASKKIQLSVWSEDKWMNISVQNKGGLISKDQRGKLFEKFYRGRQEDSASQSGTGIGLYISNEIVKAHDGIIEIESDGKTNAFVIKIPHGE